MARAKSTRINAFIATLCLSVIVAGSAWSQEDLRQRFGLTPLPPIPIQWTTSITRIESSWVVYCFSIPSWRRNGYGLWHVHLPFFRGMAGCFTVRGWVRTACRRVVCDRRGVEAHTMVTISTRPTTKTRAIFPRPRGSCCGTARTEA